MYGSQKLFPRAQSTVSSALLILTLLFSLAPRLHADDRCQHRIAHAEHDLHEAIRRHGYRSPQAEHERRELHAVRERCWDREHRWWDEHERRWHTERDWDDRDHDRDYAH